MDNLEIANIDTILNPNKSGEAVAVLAEFKLSLNSYLKNLVVSPVRSLADVIAFNNKNAGPVCIKKLLFQSYFVHCRFSSILKKQIFLSTI